jgi:glutathione S-transferase
MSATLYAVHSSHSAHAARLMLEHKGIEHRVVNFVPGAHAALLRPLGFRHGTVPALRLGRRRVQGSRAISRAIEEVQPEPSLFPADPQARIRVEEAERWGDHILQLAPRRLGGWINVRRPELRTKLAREAGVPASSLVGSAGWPVAWYFAHKSGPTTPRA